MLRENQNLNHPKRKKWRERSPIEVEKEKKRYGSKSPAIPFSQYSSKPWKKKDHLTTQIT